MNGLAEMIVRSSKARISTGRNFICQGWIGSLPYHKQQAAEYLFYKFRDTGNVWGDILSSNQIRQRNSQITCSHRCIKGQSRKKGDLL
jgi:hypothetical protein